MSAQSHHIVPFKTYIQVFIGLLALTFLTVVAARFDFGALNAIVAMGIATVKAGMVALYFMHLKYEDKTNLVIFLLAIFFLIVFFLFSFLDIATRVPVESAL